MIPLSRPSSQEKKCACSGRVAQKKYVINRKNPGYKGSMKTRAFKEEGTRPTLNVPGG